MYPALKAAEILRAKGVDCGVINMRFIKPLDTQLIDEAVKRTPKLVTVEDNVLAGGFGSAVAEYVEDTQKHAHLLRLGIGDEFAPHGKSALLYDQLGLSEQTIAKQILQWKIK